MATAKPGQITDWDLMQEQIIFYRTHLDIFIEDQFGVKFTPLQQVIVRAIGNQETTDIKIVLPRGFGKTYIIAYIAFGLCCLYPDCLVAVCAPTAQQATLVLGKLAQEVKRNKNMANQLQMGSNRNLVQISGDHSGCIFKNGSEIKSRAMSSMRGLRAKFIIVDESRDVDQKECHAIVDPLSNYRRPISFRNNFEDIDSKVVHLTSACEKSKSFFDEFMKTIHRFGQGDRRSFMVCCDWHAAVENGLTKESFFLDQAVTMDSSIFEMEYGSVFKGSSSGSFFPQDLVQRCRTQKRVELKQPRGSKARYAIGVDIATATDANSDNAVITVIKWTEHVDGSFSKKLVYMRSYHGLGCDKLAEQLRKIYHLRFPNTQRVVYDARGLGDSFSKFLDDSWIDDSGNEYPPLIDDDTINYTGDAIPVLHPFRATNTLNNRLATALRSAIDHQTLQLPINARIISNGAIDENGKQIQVPEEQLAIFYQTDALQFEMGNVCQRISSSGNFTYDTSRNTLHKDRYSSLAMVNDYITQLEEKSVNRHKRGPACLGIVGNF